jgi:hypothetical protein
MREQLLAASRTNLSPDFIEVFVSGRVKEPGPQSLHQGATLNQAIASAGGAKISRGRSGWFLDDCAKEFRFNGLRSKPRNLKAYVWGGGWPYQREQSWRISSSGEGSNGRRPCSAAKTFMSARACFLMPRWCRRTRSCSC